MKKRKKKQCFIMWLYLAHDISKGQEGILAIIKENKYKHIKKVRFRRYVSGKE